MRTLGGIKSVTAYDAVTCANLHFINRVGLMLKCCYLLLGRAKTGHGSRDSFWGSIFQGEATRTGRSHRWQYRPEWLGSPVPSSAVFGEALFGVAGNHPERTPDRH